MTTVSDLSNIRQAAELHTHFQEAELKAVDLSSGMGRSSHYRPVSNPQVFTIKHE
jgi:hypothetical protein